MEIIYLEQACGDCFGTGKRIDHRRTGVLAAGVRVAAGLSARLVAKRCGWTAPYLCQLEKGVSPWNQERMEKYLEAIQEGGDQ